MIRIGQAYHKPCKIVFIPNYVKFSSPFQTFNANNQTCHIGWMFVEY